MVLSCELPVTDRLVSFIQEVATEEDATNQVVMLIDNEELTESHGISLLSQVATSASHGMSLKQHGSDDDSVYVLVPAGAEDGTIIEGGPGTVLHSVGGAWNIPTMKVPGSKKNRSAKNWTALQQVHRLVLSSECIV